MPPSVRRGREAALGRLTVCHALMYAGDHRLWDTDRAIRPFAELLRRAGKNQNAGLPQEKPPYGIARQAPCSRNLIRAVIPFETAAWPRRRNLNFAPMIVGEALSHRALFRGEPLGGHHGRLRRAENDRR